VIGVPAVVEDGLVVGAEIDVVQRARLVAVAPPAPKSTAAPAIATAAERRSARPHGTALRDVAAKNITGTSESYPGARAGYKRSNEGLTGFIPSLPSRT
jgi:hypothetical protein